MNKSSRNASQRKRRNDRQGEANLQRDMERQASGEIREYRSNSYLGPPYCPQRIPASDRIFARHQIVRLYWARAIPNQTKPPKKDSGKSPFSGEIRYVRETLI
ncbi:hypothetical protein RRG08_049418 [Elysia crispata]|uniref:Uncharacterized protein n=1 Tax=Elysia crispata TaxID=231223 RepID=A0AAE1DL65_9GAST|nr:hypothetical protein RRG08_049418 [Elysia crispata]